MYTVQHVAARLGITPRQTRKYLRTIGDHTPGARYEFTRHDVDRIVKQYNTDHPAVWDAPEDTSAPGLPVAALRDCRQRDRFHALRRDRAARLDELLKARGMSLGQLDEHSLIVTGRALSLKEYHV